MPKLAGGVIPAVITPFDSSGRVDSGLLRDYLSYLAPKVTGLFLCGSYGSGPLMNVTERKMIAETAREAVNSSTDLIVHIGTPDTATTVELSKHAASLGVTAVAAVTPFYYRHSEVEIEHYYRRLIDSVAVPVLAYNNPKYTNFSMSPELVQRLSSHGLGGVKDSSGDISLFSAYVAAVDQPEFTFLIGSQTLLLPALVVGGHGCVSGLSNAFPELVRSIQIAWAQGDYSAAVTCQREANALRRLTGAGIPIPFYHGVLPLLGVNIGLPRPPFLPLDEERRNDIRDELLRMGLISL